MDGKAGNSFSKYVLWFCAAGFLVFATEFLWSFNFDPAHLLEHNLFDVSARHYQEVIPGHLNEEKRSVNFHAIAGVCLLLTGLLQLSDRFRKKHRQAHRVVGVIYMILGFAASGMGLVIADKAIGGAVTFAAFLAFAAFWIFTAIQSLRFMWLRQYKRHRLWSVRNYFAVLATGFIRPWLFLVDLIYPHQQPAVLFPLACWLAILTALALGQWYVRFSDQSISR